MNYNLLFEEKQHYITIPQKRRKVIYHNENFLNKILRKQQEDEDIFITKYAKDNFVKAIILDFDNKDNPKKAFADAKRLQKESMKHGLNTVIVKSGSKGYHTYTQIPPHSFDMIEEVDPNVCFDKFVDLIINKQRYHYKTLDNTNTSAGLHGNIRVIGSIHPKTNAQCEIIDGDFKEMDTIENPFSLETYTFIHNCFLNAIESSKISDELKEKEILEKLRKMKKGDGVRSAPEHDLRQLMPMIYGGETKHYAKGYMMMQCPYHNDSNPSMKVWEKYYYCLGCGEKGNWWSLRDKGVVDFEEEEYIRVGRWKSCAK